MDTISQYPVIDDTESKDIIKKLKEYSVQGKMFRSCLFLSVCDVLQQTPNKMCYHLAASFELMQSSLLIFDDIMDDDMFRRGHIAFHIAMQKIQNNVYSGHDAQSIASCVAMSLILLAHEEITCACKDISSGSFREILHEFNTCYFSVGFGQILDIRIVHLLDRVDARTLENLHYYKTAWYTVGLPLIIAGLYCGLQKSTVDLLRHFGDAVGLLFQLQDDVLDITGNEDALGKPIMSDVLHAKANIVLILYKEFYGKEAWRLMCAKAQQHKVHVHEIYTDAITQKIGDQQRVLVKRAQQALFVIETDHPELAALLHTVLRWVSDRKT